MIKLYNQHGMQLMNMGQQKISMKILKEMIAFLGVYEAKREL